MQILTPTKDVAIMAEIKKSFVDQLKTNCIVKGIPVGTTNNAIKNTFSIPESEQILACIILKVPFINSIRDGVIYTNKAMYLHPSHTINGNAQFPYEALCSMLAIDPTAIAPVSLMDDNFKKYPIFGMPLVDTDAGKEVSLFTYWLQLYLGVNDKKCQAIRIAAFDKFYSKFREEMRCSGLSDDSKRILLRHINDETYYPKFRQLYLENVYRGKSPEEIYAGLKRDSQPFEGDENYRALQKLFHLKKVCLYPTEKELEDEVWRIHDGMLCDLETVGFKISANYLNSLSQPFESIDPVSYSVSAWLKMAKIYIRAGRYEDAQKVAALLCSSAYNQPEPAGRIQWFEGINRRYKMGFIYDKIQTHSAPSRPELTEHDGMWLNPLHYAIILGEKNVVKSILGKCDWQAVLPIHNESLLRIYDYIPLAYLMCNLYGGEDRADILESVITQFDSEIRKIKAGMTAAKIGGYAAKAAKVLILGVMLKGIYDNYEEIQSYDCSSEDEFDEAASRYGIYTGFERLGYTEYAEGVVGEVEAIGADDYSHRMEEIIRSANSTVTAWAQSDHPIVQFLFHLYSTDGGLARSLEFPLNDYKLKLFDGCAYVVPPSFDTYQAEQTRAQSQSYAEIDSLIISLMPYENSWFSPEAHTNRPALKKEFNLLCMKYHPDVCSIAGANSIFQSVLEERAHILEDLNYT